MSRPPTVPVARLSHEDAAAAAARIRDLRKRARDPDLGAFPVVLDDQDVDAVVDYLASHLDVPPTVQAAELPDRALLVEYQRQRDLGAYERRLLALLQAGHRLRAAPRSYGRHLGLPTRQAVHMRRTRLEAHYSLEGRSAARDRAQDARARAWLEAHAGQLRAAGELLVDHRDELLSLVADDRRRRELVLAIDDAGVKMNSRRPSAEFASAAALALHLLDDREVLAAAGPVLRDGILQGLRLLWPAD